MTMRAKGWTFVAVVEVKVRSTGQIVGGIELRRRIESASLRTSL
jgi:hypothetical protein